MPERLVVDIDKWVKEGRFSSRSDAIKMIITIFQERERTRAFYNMLNERSREAKEKPAIMKRLI